MLFIIIGLLLIFAAPTLFASSKQFPISEKIKSNVKILGVLLILFGALSKCIVQVNAGHVGVQSLFGEIKNRTLSNISKCTMLGQPHCIFTNTQIHMT